MHYPHILWEEWGLFLLVIKGLTYLKKTLQKCFQWSNRHLINFCYYLSQNELNRVIKDFKNMYYLVVLIYKILECASMSIRLLENWLHIWTSWIQLKKKFWYREFVFCLWQTNQHHEWFYRLLEPILKHYLLSNENIHTDKHWCKRVHLKTDTLLQECSDNENVNFSQNIWYLSLIIVNSYYIFFQNILNYLFPPRNRF